MVESTFHWPSAELNEQATPVTDTLTPPDSRTAPAPRSARKAATATSSVPVAQPPRTAQWSARLGAGGGSGRKVRLPEIVIGVLLVAGCALAVLVMQRSNTEVTTVVMAPRPIPRGATITAADLTGRNMSGDVSNLIVGDNAKMLLGQVALVAIAGGTPLVESLIAPTQILGRRRSPHQRVFGTGRMPPDLAPNDTVRIVVVLPGPAGGAGQAELLDVEATVWSIVGGQDLNTNTIVTLRGPISLSTQVATATTVQIARVEGD